MIGLYLIFNLSGCETGYIFRRNNAVNESILLTLYYEHRQVHFRLNRFL